MKNGELLRQAMGKIDAFLTMDRNLELQQKIDGLSFGIVVIRVGQIASSIFGRSSATSWWRFGTRRRARFSALVPNRALQPTAGAHHCLQSWRSRAVRG
jgi:hypothetical protein